MKKFMFMVVILVVTLCGTVCAEVYGSTMPEYVTISGGAWAQVDTSQGDTVFIVANNYRLNTFGFEGDGYNVINVSSSTVNGYVFFAEPSSYYGNPTQLQARFTALSGLEVYEPYSNNYGGTSYRWIDLPTTSVKATNIGLQDTRDLDRQNDDTVFTTTDKVLIAILAVVIFFIVYKLFRRGWNA